jgi:WD40 repeat protein
MWFDGLPRVRVASMLKLPSNGTRKQCSLTFLCVHPGEVLASAGDDGNVILWVPSDTAPTNFGSEGLDDKESWRAKHMCRSSGAEIYDLAWSPDGVHFIIGSMDNIARIYNANSG